MALSKKIICISEKKRSSPKLLVQLLLICNVNLEFETLEKSSSGTVSPISIHGMYVYDDQGTAFDIKKQEHEP